MLSVLFLAGCLIDTERYERRKEALTDHDGDGFAQEDDCDDTDAAVFPGAAEVCDGVLQNCDGQVDRDATDASDWYPDADVDGFGATAASPVRSCDAPPGHVSNALDCDDTRTAVHPDADEVAYDGIDDDCSGADLRDVDGDGFESERVGGADCDDDDGSVHPEATDVPYDGEDQDCSGGDLEDADGDGHASDEVDGDDCDDGNPSVHAGADETWANGYTDNDCDGELEAATLLYGSSAWTGTRPGGQLGRRLGALGDVTGDGLADYLAAATYDSAAHTNGGAVFLVSGMGGGPLVGGPEMVAGGENWFLGAGLDGGPDVDGDGVPDLLVSATGHGGGSGATWLVAGATFAAASALNPEDAALATVRGDAAGTYSGSAVAFLGDVMGDGGTWYAVSAPYASAGGYAGAGRVSLFEAADRASVAMSDASAGVEGYFEGANVGGNVMPAGDVDGDGIDDYMTTFGSGDIAVIVPGGVEAPRLPDDAIFRLTGTGAGERAGSVMLGDVDGDGVRDLGCIEGYAKLRVYTLLNVSPVRTIDGPTATVEFGLGAMGDALVDLGDLDADGRDETLIALSWSEALGSSVAVVQSGADLTRELTLDLLANPLQAVATRGGGYGDRAVRVGDVDGDGFDDIVLGGALDDAGGTDAGGVLTIPVPR